MDIDSRVSRRSPTGVARAKADAVLRVLAGVSIALLIYEVWTLGRSVLLPLLANPNVLQTDFHYYYDAAIRFRADPSRLYQLSDDVIAGFTYPPPAILPFVMLSYLPLGVAMVVLTVSSYAVVILSMVLWIRSLEQRGVAVDRSNAIAVTLVAIALGPTYSNAIFGQVNAWVLICAIGFVTIGSTRPALGGTFLAAGTLAGVVIIAIALPFVPLSAYQTFSGDVLPARFDKTAVHISNQSLIAFIERFSIPPDRFLNWTGEQAIAVSGSVRAFNWLLGIAAIALLWRRATRGPRLDAIHSAAGLIALPAVIAPLGWGHTYVLVLPLIVLHLLQMRERSWLSTAAICACVIAMMVPSGRRFDFVEALPAALQNFAYSRYLLATLILIALPPRRHLDHDIPS
jgi:alpha-1,2-mannosyltransferase